MISVERTRQMLDACRERSILIVGDLMLDRYVKGIVQRISPEAPVPVLKVTGETAVPGGAANVAMNINALGGKAAVCGLVGNDASGNELLERLAAAGINTAAVVRSAEYGTIVKTRVIAEHQQVVRVDREGGAVPSGVDQEISKAIAALKYSPDGLIFEDYGKGLLTQPVIDSVAGFGFDCPAGLDPKDNSELVWSGLHVATPNYREACNVCGVRERLLDEVDDLGAHLAPLAQCLCEQLNCRHVIITLGAHGMYLYGTDGQANIIPTRAREVFDVSGAGDTVIAVTLLALAAGQSFLDAATLANYAAGVVVGKLGTAQCSRDELLEYIGNLVQ